LVKEKTNSDSLYFTMLSSWIYCISTSVHEPLLARPPESSNHKDP
jgi:hypothetical protein